MKKELIGSSVEIFGRVSSVSSDKNFSIKVYMVKVFEHNDHGGMGHIFDANYPDHNFDEVLISLRKVGDKGVMEGKLKVGNSYLVTMRRYSASIDKIEVLSATKVCYHILYESGNKAWELREQFDSEFPEYEIIEDLGRPAGVIFHPGGKGL